MFAAGFMVALSFLGCRKDELKPEGPDTPQEETEYKISYQASDSYELTVQETAEPGETVEMEIRVTDPALRVVSVLYNMSECTREEYDEAANEYRYSFEMPEEDVELTVNTGAGVFSISCGRSDLWQYSGADEAAAGEKVTFSLILMDNAYGIEYVAYGDEEDELCTQEGEPEAAGNETVTYRFSFIMPAEDVVLVPEYGVPVHRVYRRYYEDGIMAIRVQNHYRVDYTDPTADEYGNVADPDDPYWPGARIVESKKGDQVMFLVDFDLGFDSPDYHGNNPEGFITVKGLDSGIDCPVYWTEDQLTGLEAWGFLMPAEAVLIESFTEELDTFAGEEFVGDYDGFYIPYGAACASSAESAQAADIGFRLDENTVFTLASTASDRTDGYDYDIRGIYTWDSGTSLINYDVEACRDDQGRDRDGFGITGIYDSDAWVVSVIDLEDGGLSENIRYYFSAKAEDGFSRFISAANENGNRFLFQTESASGTEYWYYYASGARLLERVSATFNGLDINEEGAGSIISDDAGQALFKYSFEDGRPVFKFKGNEAGSYSGPEGELVLDGFGGGMLGGAEGTYTVDGNKVVFLVGGTEERTLLIDRSTMTYTVSESVSWDGPKNFSLVTETGTGLSSKVFFLLTIDEGAAGKAKVQVRFASPYTGTIDGYGSDDLINDTQAYVYDAGSQTLTVTNVYQGKSSSWVSERKDLVFSVSADKTGLTCMFDRIYSTSNPNKYVDLKGLTLTAETIQ